MKQNPSVLKTQHCVPVVLEHIFNCIGHCVLFTVTE